jgi:hypothetical protein
MPALSIGVNAAILSREGFGRGYLRQRPPSQKSLLAARASYCEMFRRKALFSTRNAICGVKPTSADSHSRPGLLHPATRLEEVPINWTFEISNCFTHCFGREPLVRQTISARAV